MSEFTPDTESVRYRYALDRTVMLGENEFDRALGEFNRWLADHDREVAAKAWDEGYEAGSEDQEEVEGHRYEPTEEMLSRGFNHWAENPYKNGGTL